MKETRSSFLSIVKKVLNSRRHQQEEEEQVVLRTESTRKYFLQKTSSLPLNSNINYSDSSYNSNYISKDSNNSSDVLGVNLSRHGGEEDHHHQQQYTGRRHQSVKLRPSQSSQQVNMVTPHQYFSSSSSNLPGTSLKAHRRLSLKHLTVSRKDSSTDLPHLSTEKLSETSQKAPRKLSKKHLPRRSQTEHRDPLSDSSISHLSETSQKVPRKLSLKRLRLQRPSERLSELSETEPPSDPGLDLAPAAVDAVDVRTVRMFPSLERSDVEFIEIDFE